MTNKSPALVGTGKWRTVQVALDSWPGTVRLCLINLTVYVPIDVFVWLVRH